MIEVFVDPTEARDFVLDSLEKLLVMYEAGLLTYSDIYYPIKAEPLLSEEEKNLLLSSPSRLTLAKMRGQLPRFEIDGAPVPENAAIVPQHKLLSLRIVREYGRFGFTKVRDPAPLKILSIFRTVTLLAQEKWPKKPAIFLYLDNSHRNRDLVALILFFSEVQQIPRYSNLPVSLAIGSLDEIEARLGAGYEIDTSELKTTRALKVLSHWAKITGKYELIENMLGIDREELPDDHMWWKLMSYDFEYDEKREQLAREAGLLARHAARLARWKIYGPANCANFLLTLIEEGVPEDYLRRAAEVCSSIVNYPADVILENTKRLYRGEQVIW